VLDALIDGEDGEIAGAGEAAGVEHLLEVAEDRGGAIGDAEDAVDEVGAGDVEGVAGDELGFVGEEGGGGGSEEVGGGRHGALAPRRGGEKREERIAERGEEWA